MAHTGFHLNLGGGQDKALSYAAKAGCNTVQIFTHSPRSFSFKELDMEANRKLVAGWKEKSISPVFSHCNYLINLASTDNKMFHGSLATVKKELEYARAFGCDYFVLHVGKYKDSTQEVGMQQIAKAINQLQETMEKTRVTILFETVAGQGTEIGAKFEDLAKLLDLLEPGVQKYVGVCVDTCHIFAAGYDIRTAKDVEKVIQRMDETFGTKRIQLIHVNDSKGELGDNLDRHERPGKGKIGLVGLKAFLTHQKIKHIPMVLESPWETPDEQVEDLKIINRFFT